MEQTINLQKKVVNKDNIDKLIDRDIRFFTNASTTATASTVEDLFRIYDELYFQIPAEGQINSHEYLIRKSSEIYKLYQDIVNLQPLLDEISDLRSQLLDANNTIFDLENQLNGN